MTTSWLTMANCLRRLSSCHCGSGTPSSSTCPLLGFKKRGSNWISVVLPAPEVPTRATVSPGRTLKWICAKAGSPSGLNCTPTSCHSKAPLARCTWCSPWLSSGASCIKARPRSRAAKPRVMGLATSASRLMGAISISMAVMKATNPPTVAPEPASRLCTKAITKTKDRATAAMIWVSGVMAAEAAVDLRAKRRKR